VGVFFVGALLSFALLWFVGGPISGYFAVSFALVFVWAYVPIARRRGLHPWAFLLGWITPPVVLVGALFWMMGGSDYVLARSFDRTAWIETRQPSSSDRTRLRMVESLRSSGRLDGLTRDAAVTLLGPPDARRWGADEQAWVWLLGPSRGMPIDSSFLRLRFGPDGRVVAHDVVED
jgi:hypothetical protein